ncbi:MAG: dTMP kinase [Bacteroidales bacterium]|nr:dTMP kinase [Bacteroidales bacterium]
MLIVMEGLDGAGKSTQVRMLKDYLETVCGELNYIHFPRYDSAVYGPLISRFLAGEFGSKEAVHPQLVALLFAEDRHYAAPQMRETLERGGTVLLDRYVYSNIAYQCAKLSDPEKRKRLRQWIFDTEYGDFALPRPDLNIFLDVPISFVESRLTAQRSGDDREYLHGGSDIHEADIAFQRTVREIYLEQCASDPEFVRVDCSAPDGAILPPEAIFGKVKDLLKPKLDCSHVEFV